MALDWRDIRDQKIAIVPALDNEGRKIAIARAGNDMDGRPLWYGCYWPTFKQVGDLSCGSRYFPPCDVFFDDDGDESSAGNDGEPRAEAMIELDIRRLCSNLESAAIYGSNLEVSVDALNVLRLEMRTRIDFDTDRELARESDFFFGCDGLAAICIEF